MSNDPDQRETPPDFGFDDDNANTKNDDSMFVSAISPTTVDVSLSGGEDDDENPFEQPTRTKTPTNTTNTVDLGTNNKDDDDIFGIKQSDNNTSSSAVPEPQPPTPIKQESQPLPIYPNINTQQSVPSSTIYEKQISSSTTISKNTFNETATTASKPVQKRSNENNIEITVSDPTKVGDGMSSYMTYRITTKTTLPIFKSQEFSVNRRFSDFLGLHTKLVTKHLHMGIIIPSPPEKDSISMAKVKISKEDSIPADFIDRRRALLERYLNRLVRHDKLIEDLDVREFLEMPNDLPKSKDTQALSGAGVLRAITSLSNQVTKLTTKTNEQDQWFEEKYTFIIDLQTHLKHLFNQFNTLFSQRKEAGHALKQFSISLNHLATIEEHPSLSVALTELANLEEKLDQINNEHVLKEYSILTELLKEYISLLDMVQLTFHERIKLHQIWLNAEDVLRKKRETKIKLEQTPKGADKLPQAEMEITEWEGKVVRSKEDFEHASTTIKQEIDVFEQICIDDFKKSIDNYLKNLLEEQENILHMWENYLPEANKINI